MATTAVVDAGEVAAAVRSRLEPPKGEEKTTSLWARKLCPSRFFTMAGLEKENRWRGWENERS